jgi:cyclophilin family peptidyl-prolyl cis-trans isomerase
MARTSDPDSASSQFFIIKKITEPFAENWQGKYTIIGQIISERAPSPGNDKPPQKQKTGGMDVLQSIQKNDTVNKITIYDKPLLRE